MVRIVALLCKCCSNDFLKIFTEFPFYFGFPIFYTTFHYSRFAPRASHGHPDEDDQGPHREEEAPRKQQTVVRGSRALAAPPVAEALEAPPARRTQPAPPPAARLLVAPLLVAPFRVLLLSYRVSEPQRGVARAVAQAGGGKDAGRHVNCV